MQDVGCFTWVTRSPASRQTPHTYQKLVHALMRYWSIRFQGSPWALPVSLESAGELHLLSDVCFYPFFPSWNLSVNSHSTDCEVSVLIKIILMRNLPRVVKETREKKKKKKKQGAWIGTNDSEILPWTSEAMCWKVLGAQVSEIDWGAQLLYSLQRLLAPLFHLPVSTLVVILTNLAKCPPPPYTIPESAPKSSRLWLDGSWVNITPHHFEEQCEIVPQSCQMTYLSEGHIRVWARDHRNP